MEKDRLAGPSPLVQLRLENLLFIDNAFTCQKGGHRHKWSYVKGLVAKLTDFSTRPNKVFRLQRCGSIPTRQRIRQSLPTPKGLG